MTCPLFGTIELLIRIAKCSVSIGHDVSIRYLVLQDHSKGSE